MSRFLSETITDVRSGRESWRVIVAFSLVAFAVSVAVELLTR